MKSPQTLRALARLLPIVVLLLTASAMAQTGASATPTVMVLPFENASRVANLEWISESFPEVFNQSFATRRIFAISREDRLYSFDKMGVPPTIKPTMATLFLIAQQLDAEYVVMGDFHYDGKTLEATARVLDMRTLKLGDPVRGSGPLANLLEIQKALAWLAVQQIRPSAEGDRAAFMAATANVKLEAFESFIRGLLSTTRADKIHRFRVAVDLDPNYWKARLELGRVYQAARDYDAVIEVLAPIPTNDARAAEASFLLGLANYGLEQFDRAENAFNVTLSHLPLAEIQNNLGVVELRRNKREALAHLQAAVDSDPSDPDYRYNLALAQMKFGDAASAKKSLAAEIAGEAGDNEAKQLLEAWQSGSQPNKTPRLRRVYSEASYRQLALAVSNNVEAKLAASDPRTRSARLSEHALTLIEGGHLDDADKELREALRLDGGSAPTHAALAALAEKRGDMEAAKKEALESTRLHPSVAAYLLLSRVNLRMGNPETARQNADQALWLEPGNADALAWRKKLEESGASH